MPIDTRVRPCRVLSATVLACVVALATLPSGPALADVPGEASAHAARHAVHAPRAATSSNCVDAGLMPAPGNLERIASSTLCLINQYRAAHGETALRPNAALQRAAAGHSLDMVARSYFAHVSPSGVDPLARMRSVGYIRPNAAYHVGENIAWGSSYLATPSAIVKAWMNSPEHRANILTAAFRNTGMGVVSGAPGLPGPGATYTQDFAA